VYFKTKYITQPTLTVAEVMTKALHNLTQALKGENNVKGSEQIEALKKLNNILNNSPVTASAEPKRPPQETRQVTFDPATQPPQETALNSSEPTFPQRIQTPNPITAATINKEYITMPTPRVRTTQPTKGNITPAQKMSNPARIKMRNKIREYLRTKTMARIPQRNIHSR
jgi:hypothetical protein